MKRLSAFAVLGVLFVSSSAASAATPKTITFGVDPTYPPFESLAPSGQFVGFDMDLGRAICADLDAKCVFVQQNFGAIILALKARKFDAILSTMTVNPVREQQIDFTNKMYEEPLRLIAKKGANLLPTAASLKGKTVGVQTGTLQETYAKTYWAPYGVKIVSYADQDQIYADLLYGRIDAALQDSVQADYGFLRTANGADYAFAGGPLTYDPKQVLGSYIAIGVRKNEPALKDSLNKAIADLIKNGTYKKIEAKYFNFDIYNS